MYKLVAIDLDGTLLNSYGEISNENINALKKAQDAGAKIVLASGRVDTAMESFAYQIGANEYMISGNGASIYDLKREKVIYNKYLTKEKVLEIANFCETNSMYYNVYAQRSIITKSLSYNTLYYQSENQRKPDDKQTKIDIVENIPEYIKQLKNESFLKIIVCDKDEMIFRGMVNTLKKDKEIDVLDVSHMSRKIVKYGTEEYAIQFYYTEITNKNVSKWKALEFLLDKLNIAKEEVITIGDNINDKEMIQNAGVGVAMGNSTPVIKEVADIVTASNDENGVAKVIDIYF